jgi:2-dehydropantoate 2-reductase
VHGRVTPRAERIAEMLTAIDSARTTTNLWGERWSKLVLNTSGNAVSAITGLGGKDVIQDAAMRRLRIRLAGEAIAVGQALGFELEPILGLPPEVTRAAAEGDRSAHDQVESKLLAGLARMTDEGRPSTGQDIVKGRRTEIDYLNGLVAEKGEEAGVPAPTHRAIVQVVKQIERGELEPTPDLVGRVQELAGAPPLVAVA